MSAADERDRELAALNAKLKQTGRLNAKERLRRQGLIFNHSGRPQPRNTLTLKKKNP